EKTILTGLTYCDMSIDVLLILILGFQLIILGLLFFWGKENQGKELLQAEMARMSKELAQALGEARRESSENLSQQFRLIFENQRASSKDQNEALKAFGDVVRMRMQDLSSLQREKFGELGRREDEMVRNAEMRLEKIRETVDEKLQKTLE